MPHTWCEGGKLMNELTLHVKAVPFTWHGENYLCREIPSGLLSLWCEENISMAPPIRKLFLVRPVPSRLSLSLSLSLVKLQSTASARRTFQSEDVSWKNNRTNPEDWNYLYFERAAAITYLDIFDLNVDFGWARHGWIDLDTPALFRKKGAPCRPKF